MNAEQTATDVESRRFDLIRKFGVISLLCAASIGAVAMIGWILDIDILKSVGAGHHHHEGQYGTRLHAHGCRPASDAFRLGVTTRHSPRSARVFVGARARRARLQPAYVFGYSLGVDQLLFTEPAGAEGTVYPGRMALNTSVCFVLASGAGPDRSHTHRARRVTRDRSRCQHGGVSRPGRLSHRRHQPLRSRRGDSDGGADRDWVSAPRGRPRDVSPGTGRDQAVRKRRARAGCSFGVCFRSP